MHLLLYLHWDQVFLFATSYTDTGKVGILQLHVEFLFKVFLDRDRLAMAFKFLRVGRPFDTITSNRGFVFPAVVGNLE